MSMATQPIAIIAPIIRTIINFDGLSENDFLAIVFGATAIRMPIIPITITQAYIMNLYITLPPKEMLISILYYINAVVKKSQTLHFSFFFVVI